MWSSSTSVDHHEDYYSQPRGFSTPPPTWRRNRCSPVMPGSEKKPPRRSPQQDLFHVIHKVPSGDSPYVRAKHVQLIDKDPTRSISLFWAAINSGDRVDSALKDMAVVMKQLDRSDEAIEAVKSFRHLCPPESQESLDNIVVELYKQSGRIEEEIEMLQRKVRQVEEGMAFGGKRTKMARSQGKKVQITVEKEYSRLLGNLAWAYMQHKDFKSAEENYRKALCFESDKNKQCNLALCLMHMNKLTEAKFLLQAIKTSSVNGCIDESYAKSFERASEMLAELESKCVHNPIKQTDHNKGAFTDFPYEKRSDFGLRKNHCQLKRDYESPNIPKVPFTQPKRISGSFCDGDKNEHGSYCRKLSFEPSSDSENGLKCGYKKSWAEMVEEDEQALEIWRSDFTCKFGVDSSTNEGYGDENVDSNIISETPKSLNEAEKVRQRIESIDLGEGYSTQPVKTTTNSSVKRSLCFDQNHKSGTVYSVLSEEDFSPIKSIKRRNRLQVFQDITR